MLMVAYQHKKYTFIIVGDLGTQVDTYATLAELGRRA